MRKLILITATILVLEAALGCAGHVVRDTAGTFVGVGAFEPREFGRPGFCGE